MPMNTTFVTGMGGSSRRISRTWPAISCTARLREKPIAPVAQNAHCSAHPACEEMQSVTRLPSGIATVSMASPSARRKRNFSVPSADFCRAAISRRGRANSCGEPLAERRWEIAHAREVGRRRDPQMAHDLPGAVRGQALGGHERVQPLQGLRRRQVQEVLSLSHSHTGVGMVRRAVPRPGAEPIGTAPSYQSRLDGSRKKHMAHTLKLAVPGVGRQATQLP